MAFPSLSRASFTAVTSRAMPPKHSLAAASSSEQVESKALIGSHRSWKSLVCRIVRSKSAKAVEAQSAIPVEDRRRRTVMEVSLLF